LGGLAYGVPRILKRGRQQVSGKAFVQRLDQPAKQHRDAAAHADHFHFHVRSLVALFKSGDAERPPDEAWPVILRQRALPGLSIVGDLLHPDGSAQAIGPVGAQPRDLDFVVGLHGAGHRICLLHHQQGHFFVLRHLFDPPRFDHHGSIEIFVAFVVIEHTHHVIEPGFGNEHRAQPIMNQAKRHRAWTIAVDRAHQNLARPRSARSGASSTQRNGACPRARFSMRIFAA